MKEPYDYADEREQHPTFGMAALHKSSCGGDGINLFGSSVRHHNFITLTISQAERVRSLHSERAFSGKMIAEIRLSPVQLSELLTSINSIGVPCTLKYYRGPEGKLIDAGESPETPRARKTYDEFKAHTKTAVAEMRQLQKRLRRLAEAGKPVGKRALEQLAIDMGVAAQQVDANMPFIMDRFSDACEETVRDAKGEIEAFIGAKIEATGIKALRTEAPNLPLLGNTPEESP